VCISILHFADTLRMASYGAGMSQHEFMLKDECLVVNYNDEIIGSDNKYNVHKFVAGQPKGIVHRAFSVMLFDDKGRLLLQQRAASKITFPHVWTNTCCSHPLHGQTPPEVDEVYDGKTEPMGIKHAAVRKLRHELGTKAGALKAENFKYMGRVHYWAADSVTHGPNTPWGEHEIDYLLLYQMPPGTTLELAPNAEEVMAVDWVTAAELTRRMEDPTLLWSPWFRVIARELLFGWWGDLDKSLKLMPYSPIRRFDAPSEHRKGGGVHDGAAATELADLAAAESKLEWTSAERRTLTLKSEREARRRDLTSATRSKAAAAANKQGAYGKVPTHSHSKKEQLSYPLEIACGLYLKFVPGALPLNLKVKPDDTDLLFCDVKLGEVSRSFAAVIRQLPSDLAVDILIFYIVLRGLDTVEDDMTAFKGKEHVKCEHLRAFGREYLGDEKWSMSGVGEGAERELLEGFGAVSRVFNRLPKSSQDVIRDITIQMGDGMADFVSVDMGQGTVSCEAYARYCHMVAGLVGEGLSLIFVGRGMETEACLGQGVFVWPFCKAPADKPANTLGIANSMGLFLQKTNILRDYLEDYVDNRAFWPQDVWKKFARTNDLGEFARPTAHGAGAKKGAFDAKADPLGAQIVGMGTRTTGLDCLNFLVADALELVPDCLTYLEMLKTPEVFRFCAIPQVMAIATLEEVFDNPKVFTGVVKIRKGLTARLLLDSGSLDGVYVWFNRLARRIASRCPKNDPSREKILKATTVIVNLTQKRATATEHKLLAMRIAVLFAICAAVMAFFFPKALGLQMK
jgi:farnesyl-diphosphate farnesyltransferase